MFDFSNDFFCHGNFFLRNRTQKEFVIKRERREVVVIVVIVSVLAYYM